MNWDYLYFLVTIGAAISAGILVARVIYYWLERWFETKRPK